MMDRHTQHGRVVPAGEIHSAPDQQAPDAPVLSPLLPETLQLNTPAAQPPLPVPEDAQGGVSAPPVPEMLAAEEIHSPPEAPMPPAPYSQAGIPETPPPAPPEEAPSPVLDVPSPVLDAPAPAPLSPVLEPLPPIPAPPSPVLEKADPVIPSPVVGEAPREIPSPIVANPALEVRAPNDDPAQFPPKPLSNEAVTGHTAALWKYRPIPQDQPDPFPEHLTLCQNFPAGRFIGARVRGKKHKHEGTNCDDWFSVSGFQNLLFIAVSDGAGSRKFSRIGAQASCRAAVGCMAKSFSELWTQQPDLAADICLDIQDPRCMNACGVLARAVQEAVLKARDAVEAAFYTRAADPAYEAVLGRTLDFRDLSATLLAAAVIPAGNAGRLVISCQVGDGMIALVDSKAPFASSLKLMGVPDSGEFSGETEFLTSPKMASLDALQNRTMLSLGRSDTLLIMTDGVADDYFPNETELRRLYFDLLANGILERDAGPLSAEQLRIYKSLPAPLSYPSVNDQSVQVPLHYTRRILETPGLTPEVLWESRSVLALARQELEGQTALEDPAERLRRWLDNYVERGSFDDRTLAVVELKEA